MKFKTARKLDPEFTFAGFSFPKYQAILPKGSMAQRLERARKPVCGNYYGAPKPIIKGPHPGITFYLDSDFSFPRWLWADKVDGVRINHKGWFCDDYEDSTIRGLVIRLPHGRFLAGWSMGKGMVSFAETELWDNEADCARYADSLAESAAEKEREYQEQESARLKAEEEAALEEAGLELEIA